MGLVVQGPVPRTFLQTEQPTVLCEGIKGKVSGKVIHPFSGKDQVKAKFMPPNEQRPKNSDILSIVSAWAVDSAPGKISEVFSAVNSPCGGPNFLGKSGIFKLAVKDFVFQFGEKIINFCVNCGLRSKKLRVLQHI